MVAEPRSNWPFWAGSAGMATASSRLAGDVLMLGDQPTYRVEDLLAFCRLSHRGARWALPGTLVGGSVFLDADAQALCEIGCVGVGQGGVRAFDAAQRAGGDLGGGSKLGLGQAFDDTPVPGIALVDGYGDDLLDRSFQDAHDTCQQVDLGGSLPALPVEDCRLRDVGEAGEVTDRDAVLPADFREGLRVESAQYAPRHTRSEAWRVIARQVHRDNPKSVNDCVIDCRHRLEYGVACTRMMGRDWMKLPRALAQRPTPQMPVAAGLEPRFDLIPSPRLRQPAKIVRPLYWWAKDLRARGHIVLGLRFDPAQLVASVTVRLSSDRVVGVARRPDDKPRRSYDLPELMAEAVWRLGALGWTEDLESLVNLLRAAGLMTDPAAVRRCILPIPGWQSQPDRAVRIAYWWALDLLRHGWRLHACGEAIAQGGFIAEIPDADRGAKLVIYPGTGCTDDGTTASALANHLGRLTTRQRQLVQRAIADAMADKGRVI